MVETTQAETKSAADGRDSSGSRLRLHAGEVAQGLAHAARSGSRLLAELVTLSPLAVLIGLVALGAWWHEHNQHLRQAGELQELKKQTAADVGQLQSQAAAAAEEANRQRAGRIVSLELERQKSERDAAGLRQRLAALESEEQQQTAQVAALPTAQVASGLASRLGAAPDDFAPAAASTASATAAPDNGTGAASQATPAGPAENAPSRQAAGSSPPPATPGTGRSPASALDEPGQARPPAPPGTAYFRVSEAALRKMDAALVSLDGCRRQAQVKDGLLADCQQQAQSSAAIIDEQKASLGKLNEALADKDQILAKRETEHQAELKVARGTFSSRVVHTLEHVAIGVAIGFALKR
ncbi:MAG TPA: hypothetical protein VG204_03775 [Terriglobia bacterium]|nr:hypothetical protein [Terriglobia bacterium]